MTLAETASYSGEIGDYGEYSYFGDSGEMDDYRDSGETCDSGKYAAPILLILVNI